MKRPESTDKKESTPSIMPLLVNYGVVFKGNAEDIQQLRQDISDLLIRRNSKIIYQKTTTNKIFLNDSMMEDKQGGG
ncbi:MAG: hypothetical protein WC444_05695 [Candidatus Paceibacterota bacterium]